MSKVNLRSNNKKFIAIFLFLACIAIIGSIILFGGESEKKKTSAPKTDEVITVSTDNPDETPIGDDFEWKGKDSDPKYISFPTIKAEGFLQKVSVDQRKEVGVPSNIHLAGWFKDMAVPGAPGLSVIDGHVDGISKPGVFKNLEKLKKDQKFTLEFGSGKTITFKVISNTKINEKDAPSVLFSQDPSQKSQLNLITCGGTYDKKARHYLDRIIIGAVPV